MTDVTVKRFDELESYRGQFVYAGRGLGVRAWGMNVLKLPPNWMEYPEHDHATEDQVEDARREGPRPRIGPRGRACGSPARIAAVSFLRNCFRSAVLMVQTCRRQKVAVFLTVSLGMDHPFLASVPARQGGRVARQR